MPYIRIAGRSKRLDRGHCASVTGQLLRATTLLQATIAIASRNGSTGAPTTSELRSVTRSRGSRRLISQGSGEESNLFSGLAADGSYVYSTRIGVRPTSAFVRIDRRSGAAREVRAQTGLDGGLALDAGRVTYLELQGTFKGGDCGAANPCRIVRASADPFGSEERPLAPKLALVPPFDTQDPAAQPRATQPLTLSGKLTRSIVQGGEVVRTEVVPGVPIELRGGQRYEATGLTTTTDAEGAFALTVAAPLKPFSSFLVRTGGPDVPAVTEPLGVDARPDVTLSTSAAAVPSGGQVTFSGTVDPAQPGRTVKIQRLVRRTCKTGANGRRFCQEDFETVADAPLAADGRSFSTTASLSQSGEYTAVLPFVRFDQPGADTAYAGRSEVKAITVG